MTEPYRHPAQGLENLHPTDRITDEVKALREATQIAYDYIEKQVEADGSAVVVLNKMADLLGWDRKR